MPALWAKLSAETEAITTAMTDRLPVGTRLGWMPSVQQSSLRGSRGEGQGMRGFGSVLWNQGVQHLKGSVQVMVSDSLFEGVQQVVQHRCFRERFIGAEDPGMLGWTCSLWIDEQLFIKFFSRP